MSTLNLGLLVPVTSVAGTPGQITINGGFAPANGAVIVGLDGSSVTGSTGLYNMLTGMSGSLVAEIRSAAGVLSLNGVSGILTLAGPSTFNNYIGVSTAGTTISVTGSPLPTLSGVIISDSGNYTPARAASVAQLYALSGTIFNGGVGGNVVFTTGAQTIVGFKTIAGTNLLITGGNLGIGTGTFAYPLQVVGGSNIPVAEFLHDGTPAGSTTGFVLSVQGNTANGRGPFMLFKAPSGASTAENSAAIGGLKDTPAGGGRLVFCTNEETTRLMKERVRIDQAGYVSIAVTTPSSSYGQLTVSGIGITIGDDGNAKLQIGRYSAGVPYSYIKMSAASLGLRVTDPTDNIDLITLLRAGYFGIGTNSPSVPLHVTGSALLATTAGSVGIGVTPVGSSKLDVQVATNRDVRLGDFTLGPSLYAANAADTAFTGLYLDGSFISLQTRSNGYVGIGTAAPSAPLHVTGSALFGTTAGGRVGIGTSAPLYTLEVSGSFGATTKSFDIPHPLRGSGWRLVHGVSESNQHTVFYRGILIGSGFAQLPDYWSGLVHEDSLTVHLTPIGRGQNLNVTNWSVAGVNVDNEGFGGAQAIHAFYRVEAERKDVARLIVEKPEGV